jgi:hypothetical protein
MPWQCNILAVVVVVVGTPMYILAVCVISGPTNTGQ